VANTERRVVRHIRAAPLHWQMLRHRLSGRPIHLLTACSDQLRGSLLADTSGALGICDSTRGVTEHNLAEPSWENMGRQTLLTCPLRRLLRVRAKLKEASAILPSPSKR
jgi:hypothetical protein